MANVKKKIIADDKIPFLKGVLEPFVDIEYYPGKEITNKIIKNADALITRTRTKCNKDLLDGSTIKLITTATIGYDHIDTKYCDENNIRWINAPGCNSSSVMQYITSALLTIAKKERINLFEKTIGIIGVGNVGSKIQKVAEILGMKILLNDPPRERKEGSEIFSSLKTIIDEADIITFHVPLNKVGIDKTYHLADDNFFNQLKKKPIIINSSRGEVVETNALKSAIKNKKISNVILDVWENEPNIDLELLNLIDFATPHIAGYSADGKAKGTSVCVNEINEYFNLGLEKNWYPKNIPLAKNGNEININCSNKEDQEIFFEIVELTYSIIEDDSRLRNSVTTFEKQRGDYPIRREFVNYYLNAENISDSTKTKLSILGFNFI
ncbi:MAG: 4-phosphoerythronate dehydrogenase PdxB [Ignavibacteriae bacterium]|nr:4-phosphoerythronate dehydrogenase PdxB [Ignavibacteriota bacterium]